MAFTTQTEKREADPSAVRAEGKIPAVVYGPEIEPIVYLSDIMTESNLEEVR